MSKWTYSLLKSFRLGQNLKLSNSEDAFEAMHFIKHMSENNMHSWARDAKGLLELIHKNRPLSHLIGEHPFMDCNLAVFPKLLIPRPETEDFVAKLIQNIKMHRKYDDMTLKILDVGSGTGCIAIGLAANLDNVHVVALDRNPTACKCIKHNISANLNFISACKSTIDVVQCDLFSSKLNLDTDFDIIVSNPPYIPTWRRKLVAKSVIGYEDYRALFPPSNDHNGLMFHDRIIKISQTLLKRERNDQYPKMVMEFDGRYQIQSLKSLLKCAKLSRYKIKPDIFGRPRTVWIY